MTVIPFLIIGLLVGASASTLPTDLVCDTNPLRVHRSPKYLPEVTQITDDFYQIGWSVVHASNGETTIPYEIILLKSANTYKVHAIGSDLSVYNQTYTSTNPTQLL